MKRLKTIALVVAALGLAACQSAPADQPRVIDVSKKYTITGKSKNEILTVLDSLASNKESQSRIGDWRVDREKGIIVRRGVIDYPCYEFACFDTRGDKLHFKERIVVADGEYHIVFTDLYVKYPSKFVMGRLEAGWEWDLMTKREIDKVRPALLKRASMLSTSINSAL